MSSIAGIVANGAPVPPGALERMVSALAAQRNEQPSTHVSQYSAMAQLRTGPSTPVRRVGGLVVVSAGEIYGRDVLCGKLGLDWRDPSLDTPALIAEAWLKWHHDAPAHIDGEVSFVVVPAGEKGSIFCVSDRFGVRPIYHCLSGDVFIFASEVKGILASGLMTPRVNRLRVGQLLMNDRSDSAPTLYQGVLKLQPGLVMRRTPNATLTSRYWNLADAPDVRLSSDAEYADGYREVLTSAVRRRTAGVPQVGTNLSGGLDSSSLTVLAAESISATGRLPVFSGVFSRTPECDETIFINPVVQQGRYLWTPVDIDELRLFDFVFDGKQEDEPLFSFGSPLNIGIYRAASTSGTAVLLDGFGGDSTVSFGLGRLNQLRAEHRFRDLARELRMVHEHAQSQYWWLIRHYLIAPGFPDRLRPIVRGARSLSRSATGASILNRELAASMEAAARRQGRTRRSVPRSPRADHEATITWGGNDFSAAVLDRSSAPLGIEPRYPFLDAGVAEYCVGLPPEQKLQDGWPRIVARRAMERKLPDEVCWRQTKASLGPYLVKEVSTNQRELVEDFLHSDASSLSEVLDLGHVRRRWRTFVAAPDVWGALEFWRIVVLGLWLRRTSAR